MKISCNILKKHIKNSDSIDFIKVWDKFTIRCAEVDGIEVKGNNFSNVITAKIIDCQNHPSSNKLHVLKVDTGKDILQIVCGAPNVRVGLIGALVQVGGKINDMEISVRPLVGIDSFGMMCSGRELGISDNHDGIIELPDDTSLGKNIKEVLPIDDIIVEIDNKSLTHRPDLWGHYGIAREIAAITNQELIPLDLEDIQSNKSALDIKISNSELCHRYIGLKVENIKNKKTPLWLQIFLYYSGMRSIDLIVDLTNYIMLELGTPMHAFDARVVKNIEVGLAKQGDKFVTLDNIERNLTDKDLMIKNGGEYFALAGVMGGLHSEIVEDTDSIFLESACFDATTVRKTAINLGLRTEASARYEKSLDPNLTLNATKRYVKLLKNINPALSFASSLTDVYPHIQNENIIELSKELLYKYMDFSVDDELVISILTSLSFKVENLNDKFVVTAPTYRSTKDITIAQDLIEEIARIYGYENFAPKPLKMIVDFKEQEKTYETEYQTKYLLSTKYNLHEVHTYLWNKTLFLKKIGVDVINTSLLGKNEDNILRKDLALSMLEVAANNINNYNKFGIFEIGTIVDGTESKRFLSVLLTDSKEQLENTYKNIKEIIFNLIKIDKRKKVKFDLEVLKDYDYYMANLTQNIIVDNQVIGHIAPITKLISNRINKKNIFVVANIDMDKYNKVFVDKEINISISKYPETILDYTIIISKEMIYKELEEILQNFEDELIINYKLLDIFVDDNIKKVTIRYTIGSKFKTLENNELVQFKDCFINYIKMNKLGIEE